MERYFMFLGRKNESCENDYTTKYNLQIQYNPYQITNGFFHKLFNIYTEYIMRNAELDEAQAGIKIAGEISINSDMQMTPPLWQKVKKN